MLRGREGKDAAAALHRPPIPELFRVPGALVRIRAKLAEIAGTQPFDAFLPRLPRTTPNRALVARSAVGSTFRAALELARGAELVLERDDAFRPSSLHPSSPRAGAGTRMNIPPSSKPGKRPRSISSKKPAGRARRHHASDRVPQRRFGNCHGGLALPAYQKGLRRGRNERHHHSRQLWTEAEGAAGHREDGWQPAAPPSGAAPREGARGTPNVKEDVSAASEMLVSAASI